jgi:CxxC-x17-CxxC domain-containing protein
MPNFNRSGGGRGGNKFGKRDFGKRSFGDRDSARPVMHKAICGECGNSCEVPFKPVGDRPVYCKNCFNNNGGDVSRQSDERGHGKRDFGRDSERPGMHKAICDECGNACEVPFRPTGDKPIYCRNCFKKDGNTGAGGNSGNKNNDQFKEQIEALNDKLDRILKILTSVSKAPASKEKIQEQGTEEKVKAPKPKKEAKS